MRQSNVRELFWGDYNHGGLQVRGRIRTRLLLAAEGYYLPVDDVARDGDEIGLLLGDDGVPESDLADVAAQYFAKTVVVHQIFATFVAAIGARRPRFQNC